jgi:hypothetical protein
VQKPVSIALVIWYVSLYNLIRPQYLKFSTNFKWRHLYISTVQSPLTAQIKEVHLPHKTEATADQTSLCAFYNSTSAAESSKRNY